MLPLIIVGVLALAGIAFWRSGGLKGVLPASVEKVLPASLGGYATIGPDSDPATWYNGVKPGTIYYNGQAQPPLVQGGGPSVSQTALAGAGTGLGVLGAMGAGSSGGLFGSGAMASGTMASSAIPFIGAGIAVVGTVLGLISAHHKAALAKEGQVLNNADPRAYTSFGLVVQGTVNGEITSVSQAQTLVTQIVNDWYASVQSIQRGKWPYTAKDYASNNQDFDGPANPPNEKGILPDNPNGSGTRYRRKGITAPDPCNAACYIGHYWIERSSFVVMDAVSQTLAGKHGVCVLMTIPPHATQTGVQEVDIYY